MHLWIQSKSEIKHGHSVKGRHVFRHDTKTCCWSSKSVLPVGNVTSVLSGDGTCPAEMFLTDDATPVADGNN